MRRISREELRTTIWIGLTVLKPYRKRAAGVMDEHTRKDVVDDLVARIMGDPASETVMLRPNLVGSPLSPVHGKWDIDEPHPHPDLPPTDYMG